MPRNQIERLKNDSRELDNYIHRLRKKGRTNLAHKMSMKKEFLNQTIAEYNNSKILFNFSHCKAMIDNHSVPINYRDISIMCRTPNIN